MAKIKECVEGIVSAISRRRAAMLVLALVLALSAQYLQNEINHKRQMKEIQNVVVSINGKVDSVGIKQDEQLSKLREQGNLIVCLLQLQTGRSFTDREECQRRSEEAKQRLQSGQAPIQSPVENDKGNPQGSETAVKSIPTPTPELCLLIVCVRPL